MPIFTAFVDKVHERTAVGLGESGETAYSQCTVSTWMWKVQDRLHSTYEIAWAEPAPSIRDLPHNFWRAWKAANWACARMLTARVLVLSFTLAVMLGIVLASLFDVNLFWMTMLAMLGGWAWFIVLPPLLGPPFYLLLYAASAIGGIPIRVHRSGIVVALTKIPYRRMESIYIQIEKSGAARLEYTVDGATRTLAIPKEVEILSLETILRDAPTWEGIKQIT